METEKSKTAQMGVLIPLVPAVLLYLLLLPALAEQHVTQFGQGGGESRLEASLLQLWLIGIGIGLWTMLGVQLWFARGAAGVPAWGAKALFPLFFLSALAAVIAITAMFNYVNGWSGLVPLLLPPLIALYAVWAGCPALHHFLPPARGHAVLLAPIALLVVAAMPLAALDQSQAPRNAARLEEQADAVRAQHTAELEREIAEDRARYRNLTADSPLQDYLRYASLDDERDMVARMRLVKSRQTDIVALLNDGAIRRLPLLERLDLTATPELCTAYNAALRKMVDDGMSVPGMWYRNMIDYLNEQLPNMKWLVAGGCNLNDGLAAAEAPMHFFFEHHDQVEPDLAHWQEFLATLAALRRP
jgi:hypothetical protein